MRPTAFRPCRNTSPVRNRSRRCRQYISRQNRRWSRSHGCRVWARRSSSRQVPMGLPLCSRRVARISAARGLESWSGRCCGADGGAMMVSRIVIALNYIRCALTPKGSAIALSEGTFRSVQVPLARSLPAARQSRQCVRPGGRRAAWCHGSGKPAWASGCLSCRQARDVSWSCLAGTEGHTLRHFHGVRVA